MQPESLLEPPRKKTEKSKFCRKNSKGENLCNLRDFSTLNHSLAISISIFTLLDYPPLAGSPGMYLFRHLPRTSQPRSSGVFGVGKPPLLLCA